MTRALTAHSDTLRMQSEAWRVVVVRAWRHEGRVAAVLLVGEPGAPNPVRHAAVGSIDEACHALSSLLQELTGTPTDATTTD